MLRRCTALFAAPVLAEVYGKNITVSPRAWTQISSKNREEGFANADRALRLAIDSGGCHGYLYKFAFEPLTAVDAGEDLVITERDVALGDGSPDGDSPRVVVDSLSISKLEGAVLDYHSELKGSAFVIVGNELVDQSCACAMSFSIKKKKKSAARADTVAASKGNSETSATAGAGVRAPQATQIRRQKASS